MFATVLQLLGLLLLIVAGCFVSFPAALAAVGVVCVYVGAAADRSDR